MSDIPSQIIVQVAPHTGTSSYQHDYRVFSHHGEISQAFGDDIENWLDNNCTFTDHGIFVIEDIVRHRVRDDDNNFLFQWVASTIRHATREEINKAKGIDAGEVEAMRLALTDYIVCETPETCHDQCRCGIEMASIALETAQLLLDLRDSTRVFTPSRGS